MSGADDIAAERKRQIEQEGWSADHDDKEHNNGSLVKAAICYARMAAAYGRVRSDVTLATYRASEPPDGWPWSFKWWKPKDPRRDLVRAGALIAAEIDRLDREASAKAA